MIATLILEDADNPIRNETNNAVTSLTPHPPILTGSVIEKRMMGENTKNAR